MRTAEAPVVRQSFRVQKLPGADAPAVTGLPSWSQSIARSLQSFKLGGDKAKAAVRALLAQAVELKDDRPGALSRLADAATLRLERIKTADPAPGKLLADVKATLAKASAATDAELTQATITLDRGVLLAEIAECRHLWQTVTVGLGDWSVRVDYEQNVARPLIPALDALAADVAQAGEEGTYADQAAALQLRLRQLRVQANLLETEHRFARKREGSWNGLANSILDNVSLSTKEIWLDDEKTQKARKSPSECAQVAKDAVSAARTGFDSHASPDQVEGDLKTANDNMNWYDKLRGDFVETWAVTGAAYIPSVVMIEPFLRMMEKAGQVRWDHSTKWGDMLKLLGFKEILNMLVRFVLMGRDFSVTDKETVSGSIVEVAAGAAVTGAVTFGSSWTQRKLKTKSSVAKAFIDATWGAVAGYFGGVATWAAIPESARGGSLHDCGVRSVKNDIWRFGLGHLIISGYDFVRRSLWPPSVSTSPLVPGAFVPGDLAPAYGP